MDDRSVAQKPPRWIVERDRTDARHAELRAAIRAAMLRAAIRTSVLRDPPSPPPAVAKPPWEIALLTSSPSKAIWGSKYRDGMIEDGLVRPVHDAQGRWIGDVRV